MEKLVLKDGTEISINEGVGLGNITASVDGWDAAADMAGKLTKDNLSHVQFLHDEELTAEYHDMILIQPLRVTTDPEFELSFGIRKQTTEELQQEGVQTVIAYLTDEQALTVKELYPVWSGNGVGYAAGDRVLYSDVLYKCLQAHTSQSDWAPGVAPSLWTAIESGEHAGTLEDPIPAKANMEYEYGKYYSEGEDIYLCKRGGVENPEEMYGQKVTLQYLPSYLVHQYFELVE